MALGILYYRNVIDVLRGEAEPETDGREGLKSLELLIAAYLSARDGKTISSRLLSDELSSTPDSCNRRWWRLRWLACMALGARLQRSQNWQRGVFGAECFCWE